MQKQEDEEDGEAIEGDGTPDEMSPGQ